MHWDFYGPGQTSKCNSCDLDDPNGDDFYFVYSSTNPSYTSFNGTQGNYQESLIINKEKGKYAVLENSIELGKSKF